MKKKNKNYDKIFDAIEKLRSKNNKNWVDILRLAFKHAPVEASKLLKKVNKKDRKISSLLAKL